jgi:hypothetical protein
MAWGIDRSRESAGREELQIIEEELKKPVYNLYELFGLNRRVIDMAQSFK